MPVPVPGAADVRDLPAVAADGFTPIVAPEPAARRENPEPPAPRAAIDARVGWNRPAGCFMIEPDGPPDRRPTRGRFRGATRRCSDGRPAQARRPARPGRPVRRPGPMWREQLLL